MPIRVPVDVAQRAAEELRDELRRCTREDAERVRSEALAAVRDWRWSELGAPGIGDVETDLKAAARSHWLEQPPADDNDHYGLDAEGRVRVIRRRIQANLLIAEYTPERVRVLIVDDEGVQAITDVQLEGGRYARSVSASADGDGWGFNAYEYAGDRFLSEWFVGFIDGGPVPGLGSFTQTASYGKDGRLRSMRMDLEDPRDPNPASPPPIADGGEDVDVTGATLTAEEHVFVDALTDAIVADLATYPPNGPLVRFVLRWFDWSQPEYMTLHALGGEDEYAHDDAWLPLEWSNVDAELERTHRITDQPAIQEAGANLGAIYELVEDVPEEHPPPPAIREVVRRLPAALGHLPHVGHFAVAASHFEAYGILASLHEANPPSVIAALTERDELPEADE